MPQVATTVRFTAEEVRNLVSDAANKQLKKEIPEGTNAQGKQITFDVANGELIGAVVTVGDAKALPTPVPEAKPKAS